MRNLWCWIPLLLGSFLFAQQMTPQNIDEFVEHGYVDNQGVKIHYATLGKGPLVVMVHGFPDYWYTWRHQMFVLKDQFQVVAIDLRGYNKSDKPQDKQQYTLPNLMQDLKAVVEHFPQQKITLVGHDWGGMISWQFTMHYPQYVERLIVCNSPHPRGILRELANNPQQQQNSEYARKFQQEQAHQRLSPEKLTNWVKGVEEKKRYLAAFQRSDIACMLHYYKVNYPRPPYQEAAENDFPQVKCPVLIIYGLEDWALLPASLNGTWNWLEKDLTLVTLPGVGHFVQQDAAEEVTRNMVMWLNR